MATTTINLPLYRVLKALNVPEAEAEAAAETGAPDLSQLATKEDLARFATKEELRAEIAVLRSEMKAEIAGVRAEVAGAIQKQTTWIFGALIAAVGVIVAVQRLLPPPMPADAARPVQAQPGAATPPRATPQP